MSTTAEVIAIDADDTVTCSVCGSSICLQVFATTCKACSEDGCTPCKPVTKVDGEMICDHCFFRVYPEGVMDAVVPLATPVQEPQDEAAWFEGDSVSNFTTDEESECEDEDVADVPDDIDEIHLAAEEVAGREVLGKLRKGADRVGDVLYRHETYRTLHWLKDAQSSVLACGRQLSSLCNKLDEMPPFPFPKCFFFALAT